VEWRGKSFCNPCASIVTTRSEVKVEPAEVSVNKSAADISTTDKALPSISPEPPPVTSTITPTKATTPDRGIKLPKKKLLAVIGGVIGLIVIVVVAVIIIGGNFLGGVPGNAMPLFTPEELASLEAKYPLIDPQLALEQQREDKAKSVLQTSGLPVLAAFIEPTDAGKKVLVVVLDFNKLALEKSPGAFITAAVQSLVKVAGVKTLDISGISYVTVALQDSKERIIIEAGVQATDIDAFRTSKINQSQFIKRTIVKIEDRFAAWDAKNKGTQ
jgi:hypothetical protein